MYLSSMNNFNIGVWIGIFTTSELISSYVNRSAGLLGTDRYALLLQLFNPACGFLLFGNFVGKLL